MNDAFSIFDSFFGGKDPFEDFFALDGKTSRDGENRSAYWNFLEISENFLTISYSVFMNLFSTKKDS